MVQKAFRNGEKRGPDTQSVKPTHLVEMVYDLAITACEEQDITRATRAINALREALSFSGREFPGSLFRLYQSCLDCLYEGDYGDTALTLRDLREAWAAVEK